MFLGHRSKDRYSITSCGDVQLCPCVVSNIRVESGPGSPDLRASYHIRAVQAGKDDVQRVSWNC